MQTKPIPAREMLVVGFMRPKKNYGYMIICADCVYAKDENPKLTPIYRINIEPYSQTCAECGKVLVKGAPGWCELYDTEER